jgi:hypothetical protein
MGRVWLSAAVENVSNKQDCKQREKVRGGQKQNHWDCLWLLLILGAMTFGTRGRDLFSNAKFYDFKFENYHLAFYYLSYMYYF